MTMAPINKTTMNQPPRCMLCSPFLAHGAVGSVIEELFAPSELWLAIGVIPTDKEPDGCEQIQAANDNEEVE